MLRSLIQAQAQPELLQALKRKVTSAVEVVQPPERPLLGRTTPLRFKSLAVCFCLLTQSDTRGAEPLQTYVQEANVLRKAHRIRVLGADVPAPLKVILHPSADTAALELSPSCRNKLCQCKEAVAWAC